MKRREEAYLLQGIQAYDTDGTYLTICAEQEVQERGFAHEWWTRREVPHCILTCGAPERLVRTVQEERAELLACARENEEISRI